MKGGYSPSDLETVRAELNKQGRGRRGVVLYIRPEDRGLILRVLEEASDDFYYAPSRTGRKLADILGDYAEVMKEQE